ncbi:MAG TPA: response regulator, partial [Steroidobacteraceae bacterium]|nr:response regulator [Steroidobacteraceae bacterium]
MPRVLIVDDHVENLYVLRVLLAAHGWQIDEAQNGIEALQKAHQQLPQLVISDLLMPVMDGYTLLKTWKTDEQLK